MSATSRLSVATVVKPHGIRGGVKLRCSEECFELLHEATHVFVAGEERKILTLQGISTSAIAYFSGVDSREAAEDLRGQHVELDRTTLPQLEAGEFYIGDLIGCAVVDVAAGKEFGRITEATQMPAGVVIEVTVEASGEKFLSPITEEAMPVFDLEGRRVSLDLAFLDVQL